MITKFGQEEIERLILGNSEKIRGLRANILKLARTDTTVPILGESGVGKELVAEALHKASPRARGPFVSMNCAAVNQGLLESELFGHVRGAFTGADKNRAGKFATADRGTIFLDEIGDISPEMQAKLLRVLETGEVQPVGSDTVTSVDVRVICSTNVDLAAAVQERRFREDLYYRLMTAPIVVPPLRDRREDIELLANYFTNGVAGNVRKSLSAGALLRLRRHTWPGNVRELRNVVQRSLIMSDDQLVKDVIIDPLGGENERSKVVRLPADGIPLNEVERQVVVEALTLNDWIQKDAAKFLKISPRVLNYKIQKHGITFHRWSKNKEKDDGAE